MRIFDCFMYYDEDLILDIRLNTLKKYVDYFVICESNFYHNGEKRDLNFNIKNFKKFQDKIIYLVQENLPNDLHQISINDDETTKSHKKIHNAHIRENYQRNILERGIVKANDDDLILVSDVDEIPNLNDVNFMNINNNIIIFEQDIFYYKLNRFLRSFIWYGTKGCKKKVLISPQWLREVKNKRFGFWRLDTYFSEKKYINKIFIKNGGWHFSNIKSAEDIELKLNSYLHHHDFQSESINVKKISNSIKNNEAIYDMFADKRSEKFSSNIKRLNIYDFNKLPYYLKKNANKFKDWLD